MIKKIAAVFIFLIAFSIYGQQKKINNYKYVIVLDRFEFLKKTDQYQTSSLTKFLLKKKGFTVFLSNEKLPSELMQNRCLALTARVIDDSGMFTVKNRIELKNCSGSILYTSKEGRSKEKEYKKGYQEAIRKAYATMTDLKYSYQPLEQESTKKEVAIPVKIVSGIKKVTPIKDKTNTIATEFEGAKKVLYGQAITNGFQLVNTKPAVVFQVLKTKVKDVFIIKNKNGILYKNNNNWIAEYYKNDVLIVEKYQIKF